MPADLYDVLGTSNDASAEEIKRAYRERVREYHPDVNDHPEGDAQFKLIRKANDVLSDPAARKDYDRLGHQEYVEKNLEDLPAVSVFPDEDLPNGARTDSDADTGVTSGTSTTEATSSTSSRSRSADMSSTSTQRTDFGSGDAGSTTSSTSTDSTAASQTGTAAASEASTADASTGERTATAGAERSSWDAATNSTQATSAESTVPAGVRRRRGLKRWYGVVALSLVTYLAGLGLYGLPRQAPLQAFVGDVTAAPVSTLLGPFPLSSPTQYLLAAVQAATAGTPHLGLVLLAGTVLLPLVVLTTVGRFGRGAAWMYAIPSLAPAACFAIWPVVAVPAWLALVGLVILPILSGGGFLVDVGRYLRATR